MTKPIPPRLDPVASEQAFLLRILKSGPGVKFGIVYLAATCGVDPGWALVFLSTAPGVESEWKGGITQFWWPVKP